MPGHFQTLLEGVANPQVSMDTLLTPVEQQLLVEWNDTQTDYPIDQCVHQLSQVERTPDAIAVVFENQQLTYRVKSTSELSGALPTVGE